MMIVFSTPFAGSFDIQANAFTDFDGYDSQTFVKHPLFSRLFYESGAAKNVSQIDRLGASTSLHESFQVSVLLLVGAFLGGLPDALGPGAPCKSIAQHWILARMDRIGRRFFRNVFGQASECGFVF
jgi:hypothetical protein